MEVVLDGVSLHYERSSGSGPVILLLHGWGVDGKIFRGIFEFLSSVGADVINLDFPGFGASGEPGNEWGVYEYASFIDKFIERLSLKDVILLGHSFGGRVAIILASRFDYVKKLILVSAAGLKPKRSIKKKIAILKYKIAKRRGKDVSDYGSEDFKALNPKMQRIFVRIVNAFLDENLKFITVPTLIVWGDRDTQTPLYMADKLHSAIKNSEIKVFSGCGHFCFLERPEQFDIVIDNFIRR